MAELDYKLSFASVPFLSDKGFLSRLSPPKDENWKSQDYLPPRDQQPLAGIIEEIDRLLPFFYTQDFDPVSSYPGKNLGAIAFKTPQDSQPNPQIRIGDFYYPRNASRFSIFRGLATSTMVKEMLAAVEPSMVGTFVMKQVPVAGTGNDDDYTVSTQMYMLPARPVNELTGFDGLYIVTLVDERYYFPGTPATLHVNEFSTWTSLINSVANNLGISITIPSIPAVYGKPAPDSQVWTNFENAAILLDALAYNVGMKVVRNLDGTYALQNAQDAATVAGENRPSPLNRVAGGDMFYSGTKLPVGDLTAISNSVLPRSVYVTFPKYVYGDDPVPHMVNSRYPNKRPSCWYEDSYGEVWVNRVPILSGIPAGLTAPISGSVNNGVSATSGVCGVSDLTLHTTAKALYLNEGTAVSGTTPLNSSGLTALAMQMAQDYYLFQVIGIDESYPGIYNWTPEALNDIIWTYSETVRMARTRVMHTEWNMYPDEFQHEILFSGTVAPKGVGGPSVPQNWSDTYSGSISVTLASQLVSGVSTLLANNAAYFPVNYRWRGVVNEGSSDQEYLYMEGTSGGTLWNIVYRGIDGTNETTHSVGSTIKQVTPDHSYGINRVRYDKGQFVQPELWQSGGIQGVVLPPQTQTIRCLTNVSQLVQGRPYWSGQLCLFDVKKNGIPQTWNSLENVWVLERNDSPLVSGKYYDGQLVALGSPEVDASEKTVYVVNEYGTRSTEDEDDNDPNWFGGIVYNESLSEACCEVGVCCCNQNVTTVLTSSSGTFTTGATTTLIRVRVWGGGGGGGGATNNSTTCQVGGGGASGGYGEALFNVTPNTGYSYVVGAGGAGGSAGSAGSSGSSTTFTVGSTTITALGGGGGNVSALSGTTAIAAAGTRPGVGSGGYLNMDGAPGGAGIQLSVSLKASGYGGSTSLGGGGEPVTTASAAGNSGTANTGGGGSGAASNTGPGARAGGNGGSGVIIVTEIC